MRILLIEDDSATAQAIELMMKNEGHNIYSTDLGEEGIDLAKLYDYDLIILDSTLPDMDSIQVIRTIRSGQVNTPILYIGARSIDDKLKALNIGADDTMDKPFNHDELIARSWALVRRYKGHSKDDFSWGPFRIHMNNKTVECNGQRIHLTGKEYQTLEFFVLNPNKTVTKEMLLNHLYGGMDEPELKIIDIFVMKLRKKLAAASGGEHYIETVWGRGYKFNPDAVEHESTARFVPTSEPAAPAAPAPAAPAAEERPKWGSDFLRRLVRHISNR